MFILKYKHVFLVVAVFYLKCTSCDISEISLHDMEIYTERISKKLTTMFHKASGYNEFEQGYKRLENEKILVMKKLNVTKISKKFINGLNDLFDGGIKSVRNIKKHAEDLHRKYKYNPDIEPRKYLHERNEPANPVRPEPTFSLNREINFNTSFIHTPVNVYNQSEEILNDVEWTKSLDETFIQNFKNNPTLLWQYFGSETGMFRTYPGSNFKNDTNDTYDCRKKIWYTETTSSSKDVVIALDMSGSMSGRNRFKISKIIILSLLQMFHQNDFFNVIYFNETVNYAIPCAKSLIHATPLNKGLMLDAITMLPNNTAGGLSNAVKGLTTAFKILHEDNKNLSNSSDCNKVIMLISDGIDNNDELDDVIRIYNADCSVVIFSFIVGDDAKNGLKRLACGNGGKYYNFKTLGSVWTDASKFQQILSHPKALANGNYVTFTPVFVDRNEQGSIIALCMEVVGKRTNNSEVSVIGVVCTDLGHDLLEKKIPTRELGMFGHGIVINNNGILLMHPSPSYVHDDIGEVALKLYDIEHEVNGNQIDQLQKNMIDRTKGCLDAEVFRYKVVGKTNRVIRLNVTYCYASITDTPFSASISMPIINQLVQSISLNLTDEIYSVGISALKPTLKDINIGIASWSYCDIPAKLQKSNSLIENFYPTASDLHNHLNAINTTSIRQKCDLETLNYLLVTGEMVSNITNTVWSADMLLEMGISSIYILTSSGYMSTFGEYVKLNRDIWGEERYMHPIVYQTEYKNHHSLIFTVVSSNETNYNSRESNLVNKVAMCMAYHASSDIKVPAAVVGLQLPVPTLKSLLNNETKKDAGFSFDCQKTDIFTCHFIDENAIIVVSNQDDKEVGQFFGKINGILMEKLIETSLYNRREYVKTKYLKKRAKTGTKSCSSILQNTYRILWNATRSIVLYIVAMVINFLSVQGNTNTHQEQSNYVLKKVFIFSRTKEFINQSGIVPCNQSYAIHSVKNTNLALIATKSDCKGNFFNYPMKTEEEHGAESTCDIEQRTKYRQPILLNCHKLRCNHSECHEKDYHEEHSFNTTNNLIALGAIFLSSLVFMGIYPYLKHCFT